jgi:hypothetical protein
MAGVFVWLTWVTLRLTLWPVARLVGEPSVTFARSWRLMRGAVWPYVWAAILVATAPMIVATILYGAYRHDRAAWEIILASPFDGIGSLLLAVLTAQLYRLRSGSGAQLTEIGQR